MSIGIEFSEEDDEQQQLQHFDGHPAAGTGAEEDGQIDSHCGDTRKYSFKMEFLLLTYTNIRFFSINDF